jgi:hypothetical protein
MENHTIKNKLSLIQIATEEKLNEFHKQMGETLNSRQILNEFIFKMNLEFDQLVKDLSEQ